MNNISFEISRGKEKVCGQKVLDISISIDGKSHPYQFLDYFGVVGSLWASEAEFYLFSCNCGSAGCAGYFDYLQTKKTEKTVQWSTKDKKLIETLGSDSFEFDRNDYEDAVVDFQEAVERELEQGWNLPDLIDVYMEDDAPETDLSQRYHDRLKWAKMHFAQEEREHATIRMASFIHYGKSYLLSYPGSKQHPVEFRYLVYRCLNRFPEEGGKTHFLRKLHYAATAVSDFIENGRTDMLSKIVENQWSRKDGSEMTGWDFIHFTDFDKDADEAESVDWSLLKIEEVPR